MKDHLQMRFWTLGGVLCIALAALTGCGGNDGEEAPPPTNVAVTPGDGRVTVTFDGVEGVDYWIFFAPGTGVTADNWFNVPGAAVIRNATSPRVIAPLVNGQIYSLAMNGRRDGGPGGPGSGTLTFTPRLAGGLWTAGPAVPNTDLRSGVLLSAHVVVGTGGGIFASPDAKAFTAVTSGVTADLNEVVATGTAAAPNYYVVGANGTILYSTNTRDWTARTSGTTAQLNSLTLGGTRWVAVGDNGTIVTSTDGITFTPTTSGTTANLYRVFNAGRFVAVGAGGTVITSADGLTWQTVTSNTTSDLRAVTVYLNRWVALGSNGAYISSTDGLTWTAQPSIGAIDVRAIARGSRLLVVGANGAISASTDGVSWTALNSGTTATLNGIALLNGGYLVVGAGGTNLTSF
jgi:hypothetical protein